MTRRVAYGALVAMAAWATYGIAHEHLFRQPVWLTEGLERFLIFTAAYWLSAIILLLVKPAWFVPLLAGFVICYSTFWCWTYFEPWAPAAVIYFLGSCWMLGRFFTRGIIALIAGLAIWVLAISIGVHFGVNRPTVYMTAFALPYLVRLHAQAKVPVGSFRSFARTSRAPVGSFGISVLGFVLLAHWLVALGPEVSSDGLAMHLAIPSMIARDGRFGFDFQQYTWALMPMGGDFAFTAGYLIGGEAAARLLNFAFLVVLAALVYRMSLRWLSESKAALVTALFASTPLVSLVTGSLFVENVWAVFIAGAAVALTEGQIAIGAMLMGAAFATKVGTSAYLLPAVIVAAMQLKRRWRLAAGSAGLLILFAAPPYWNAWRKTGNPMFPFENQVFHSRYFEPTDIMHDVVASKPPTRNGFYAATFRSSDYIEGQDGAFGFQYFLLLPAMLILWNRRAPGALIALALVGAVSSFISLPNLRYLYPALPLISIGFAWLAAEIPQVAVVIVALIALNLYFFPAAGWYHKQFALFTRTQWNEYMKFAAPQRELVKILNRTAPGEPVAFLRGEALAGLNAKAYSDTWHTYSFWKRMIEADDPAQVTALFHELGIKHVITPVPPDSPFEVVRNFVNEWTAPSGASCGIFELRNVLPTRMERLRDVAPAGAGSYDDRDWRIEYTGAWLHDRQFKRASSGSITYSKIPGDSFHFYFSGTGIEYVYTKAPNRGIAEVWIDRKKRAEIDEYSEKIEWQQRSDFSDLAPGPHTIEVRVTGRRNARSADVYVDLDEFVVG